MKPSSELTSVIERYPHSASFKTQDTGTYLFANRRFAEDVGATSADALIGLTVHDLRFASSPTGSVQAAELARLDAAACSGRDMARRCFAFCKTDSGDLQFDEVIKLPVIGRCNKVIGVVTFQNDFTSTLTPMKVFLSYRQFYNSAEAVKRTLRFLGIEQYFVAVPTEAPFKIFLAKAERLSNKQIGRMLGLSPRTVDYQVNALRNRLIDGDLRRVLDLVKMREI
jgi:hypothetical protein